HEPTMPVACVQSVAQSQRVMASPVGSLPRRDFAAFGPLTRQPPSANLPRSGRFREIEDHDDVAEIAFHCRRYVRVPAVEVETMDASARCFPISYQPRFCWSGDVIDSNTAPKRVRGAYLIGIAFSVRQHQVAF